MWQHHDIKIPSSRKSRGENLVPVFFAPIFRTVVGLGVVVATTPVVGKIVVPGVVVEVIVVPGTPVALLLASVLLGVGSERLGF